MQLAHGISLLVAFSLLTSTATAHAECAWVLWYRVTEYRDGEATEAPFDAGEAHPTLAACEGVLQQRLTEWVLAEGTDPDLKTTTRPTFVLVQDKTSLKAKRIHAYRCLPDTVDPRGVKGK